MQTERPHELGSGQISICLTKLKWRQISCRRDPGSRITTFCETDLSSCKFTLPGYPLGHRVKEKRGRRAPRGRTVLRRSTRCGSSRGQTPRWGPWQKANNGRERARWRYKEADFEVSLSDRRLANWSPALKREGREREGEEREGRKEGGEVRATDESWEGEERKGEVWETDENWEEEGMWVRLSMWRRMSNGERSPAEKHLLSRRARFWGASVNSIRNCRSDSRLHLNI